jgi:ferrous iron transport protein B
LLLRGGPPLSEGAIKETVSFPENRRKSITEKIDNILINRITGIPVFLISMWLIFQIVFKVGEYPMLWIETFFNELGSITSKFVDNQMIESILVDGVIGGVGGVLVFLPNILLLFLALAFLEGTGYMARAAFVVDKVMHVFGLHGKSAISMITGFGCSVPAFMSTRTLKSNSDRITTLLIIPFMSCGAKLPVYLLIIGAFFSTQAAGNVLFGIYLFGILIALLSAKVFKSTIFKGDSEPFVMELPPYRLPSIKSLFFQMWHKASLYLKKAATLILIASVIIWLGSNFPKSQKIEADYSQKIEQIENNSSITNKEKVSKINELKAEEASLQMKYSVIGRIGVGIEPVIKPLGFDWRIGISLISGVVAKEVVVSTMGTIYSLGETDSDNLVGLHEKLRNQGSYNIATAIALLIFVLLYVPCIAASVVFHREAAKWKYTLIYISYSMILAWILAFVGYNVTQLLI